VETRESQFQQLVRLLIKTKGFVPVALVGAVVVAIVAGMHLRASYTPRYTCEAVALARPLAVFDIRFPGAGVVNRLGGDQDTGRAPFLPEPLDVTDYATLIQSDAVLALVAEAYNGQFQPAVTAPQLKGLLTAVTQVAIKTPYQAKYHPTIQLRATASTAEMTCQLATVWSDVAEQWCQERSAAIRRQTYDYIDQQYQAAHRQLAALEAPVEQEAPEAVATALLDWDRDLQATIVTGLAEARLGAQLAMANPVPEFEVVARPVQPAAQGRPSYLHLAAAVLIGTFIGLWACAAVVVIFRDAAARLREEAAAVQDEQGGGS